MLKDDLDREIELPLPAKPALMHATVYDRLTNDGHVDEDTKIALLQLCLSCADEAGIEAQFDSYAATHRLMGSPAAPFTPSEMLGHVKNRRSAASYLARSLTMSVDDVLRYFENLAGLGTEIEKEEARLWFRDDVLPAIRVSGRPSWLFRQASGDARLDFTSPHTSCIPCRLGLPEMLGASYQRGIPFIGYAIAATHVGECRLPTFLDGSYSSVRDIWINTGSSQPIPYGPPPCVALGGFQEVVAEPPALSHVEAFFLFES